EGVRYQIYESSDGHVLFMASEQAFWKNFCAGVGRSDLFEKWPGSKYADHAKGNIELQHELKAIFKEKSSSEWIQFSEDENTPIAPVYNAKTAPNDPQFKHRLPFYSIEDLGAEQLPLPVNNIGEETTTPSKAPTVGENTEEVLSGLLGYDTNRIKNLRGDGVFG
ncbi:MAG TPA: CoA transferase, partial [Acidimicrobiales bacterium]|nr:CoA transferase [Acidimicrobiales bacterium]